MRIFGVIIIIVLAALPFAACQKGDGLSNGAGARAAQAEGQNPGAETEISGGLARSSPSSAAPLRWRCATRPDTRTKSHAASLRLPASAPERRTFTQPIRRFVFTRPPGTR